MNELYAQREGGESLAPEDDKELEDWLKKTLWRHVFFENMPNGSI
ncbi:MAG TPA: hypothetical protein VFP68_12350 [Burkholderiaceae bacterium]|nr:hypothetical protein [Burkholderiaceae bacterium]